MTRVLNEQITVHLVKSMQISKDKKMFQMYMVLNRAISLMSRSGDRPFYRQKQKQASLLISLSACPFLCFATKIFTTLEGVSSLKCITLLFPTHSLQIFFFSSHSPWLWSFFFSDHQAMIMTKCVFSLATADSSLIFWSHLCLSQSASFLYLRTAFIFHRYFNYLGCLIFSHLVHKTAKLYTKVG